MTSTPAARNEAGINVQRSRGETEVLAVRGKETSSYVVSLCASFK